MSGTQPEQRPSRDRRPGLASALAIATALITGKGVEKFLAPSLGEWPAFGVSLLAATVGAAVVALIVFRVVGGPSRRT